MPYPYPCHTKADVCSHDGTVDAGITGTPGCNWTAKIYWGDGRPAETLHYTTSTFASHDYRTQGVRLVTVRTSGTPTEPNVTCRTEKFTVSVEVPLSPTEQKIVNHLIKSAEDFNKGAKAFLKGVKNGFRRDDAKKLQKLVKLGKKGKALYKQYKNHGIPKSRTASPPGLKKGSFDLLYKFAGKLVDMARLPEVQRAKADLYYKSHEGKFRMDLLATHFVKPGTGAIPMLIRRDAAASEAGDRQRGAGPERSDHG